MIFVNPLYRNVSIVIPAQAGIRFFEFQSFLIHSHHFSLPDSRFCGNDGGGLLFFVYKFL
ncbi:hypothetical protein A6J47_005390 [Neisseria meningitidis]|nr:hypothetical protein [Neisseria meningitidis]PNL81499.1 hypothetical protein A6J47_005390 [Neisseria meningitidis]